MSEKYSVQQEAQEVCHDVLARLFVNDTAPYDHERAAMLANEICDMVVSRLSHGRLPRKYVANATIIQKIGAGLHTAASASWDADSDGCYAVKAESRGSMLCILTVFGMTM
jgi:dynein light chain Tctex-type 1/3